MNHHKKRPEKVLFDFLVQIFWASIKVMEEVKNMKAEKIYFPQYEPIFKILLAGLNTTNFNQSKQISWQIDEPARRRRLNHEIYLFYITLQLLVVSSIFYEIRFWLVNRKCLRTWWNIFENGEDWVGTAIHPTWTEIQPTWTAIQPKNFMCLIVELKNWKTWKNFENLGWKYFQPRMNQDFLKVNF